MCRKHRRARSSELDGGRVTQAKRTPVLSRLRRPHTCRNFLKKLRRSFNTMVSRRKLMVSRPRWSEPTEFNLDTLGRAGSISGDGGGIAGDEGALVCGLLFGVNRR